VSAITFQLASTGSGQLPTICGHSVAGESFFFSCCNLGQLAGPTGDATLIHVANSIPGGGGGGGGVFFFKNQNKNIKKIEKRAARGF